MGKDKLLDYINEKNLELKDILNIKLFSKRKIFLVGEIDEEVVDDLIRQIMILEVVDGRKPIELYINSCGGTVYDTLALYDVMQKTSCEIHTFCLGKAMSAAAWILMAGTKGKRYAYKNSRILLHEGSDWLDGEEKVSDAEIRVKENNKLNEIFIRMLKKHTNIDKTFKEIKKWLTKDVYLSSEEAKKMGLIDKII